MDDQGFRIWLETRGQGVKGMAARVAHARRVERYYGDLDDAFDSDRFATILADLAYSREDQATGRSNSSRIPIDGDIYNNLASYRSALSSYAQFRDDDGAAGATGALDREAVLASLARCDSFASIDAFIAIQDGLGRPKQYWLLREGRRYPSKAIVRDALAHSGSEAKPGGGPCKAMLEKLGFVIIDWPAFERLCATFLARMKGFQDFQQRDGDYFEIERSYKDEVIAEVRAIAASEADDRMAGEAIFRALSVGRQGLPLGWRTLSEVEKSDPALRDRFFDAVGALARSEAEPVAAAVEAARTLEQLRDAGIAGLRRGEVLAVAISVLGTMRPAEASWFKISRIEAMGKALFGRRLFSGERFRAEDFEEFRLLMRALFDLMAGELAWRPADLFDVQGFVWVALEEIWEGEEKVTAPAETTGPEASYWFVGAAFGRTNDQVDRFLAEGIWEISNPSEEESAQVLAMQPGESIAIKAAFVRRDGLPFDNRGQHVSIMQIKARGVITGNPGDGERVSVAWEKGFAPRDWYFYTYRKTIWRIRPDSEYRLRLVRFAFFDEAQDVAWFIHSDPYWATRYGGAEAMDETTGLVQPVNLILYGPPGVGKTWKTASYAVALCDNLDDDDDLFEPNARGRLMQRYDALVDEGRLAFVTFHQSMSYEDFVEGLRPSQDAGVAGFSLVVRPGIFREIAQRAIDAGLPHVLIIDEINRANVSKVLGELITLIEPDKRLDQPEALRVKLPYSGMLFGVPSNLHIIGTMNTADRSIALLDTALRRRFLFHELMPDPALLPEDLDGVPFRALLRTLNERIEYLFDREHQIGHAYFMACETRADVDAVMRDKVIPLLQEYFYEDWGKVALVLGESGAGGRFLDRTALKPPKGMGSDDAPQERYRWSVRAEFGDDAYAQFG